MAEPYNPSVSGARLGRRNLGYGLLVSPLLAALALALAPAAARARPAYVVQDETESVAVIDTATNQVTVPSIDLGKTPKEVAITPDGTRAYVVNHGSDRVSVINTQTNQTIVPAIKVGKEPNGIAVSPDGTRAYVANGDSDSVSIIATATNQVTATIPLGVPGYAEAIAVSPDGTRAYVSLYEPEPSVVLTIDTTTDQVIGAPVVAGDGADSIAITPDGRTAYVSNANSENVTPIDLLARQAGTPIEVGAIPLTVAITPDGRTAYVADYNGGEVTVIDTATDQLGTPIPFKKNRPFKIAFTPDGTFAYITATEPGTVFPVATASGAVGSAISVGEPAGIAITPDQPPIASFTATVARPGVPVTFDAGASTDPDGSIASYGWEFGDGQSATSAGAVVQHTYPKPGSRTVTLAAIRQRGLLGRRGVHRSDRLLQRGRQGDPDRERRLPGRAAQMPEEREARRLQVQARRGEEEEAQGEGGECDREGEGEGRPLEDRLAQAQESLRQKARAGEEDSWSRRRRRSPARRRPASAS